MSGSKHVTKVAVGGALGALLWGLVPGCGVSVGGYCNKICDCIGCSEGERTDCVDDVEDARKKAGDDGCAAEFDALFGCANAEATCKEDQLEVDGCDAEGEALTACNNACDLPGGCGALDNVGACKNYVEHVNGLECLGDVQVDGSVCDEYEGVECKLAPYFNCLTGAYECKDGELDQEKYATIADCADLVGDCQ